MQLNTTCKDSDSINQHSHQSTSTTGPQRGGKPRPCPEKKGEERRWSMYIRISYKLWQPCVFGLLSIHSSTNPFPADACNAYLTDRCPLLRGSTSNLAQHPVPCTDRFKRKPQRAVGNHGIEQKQCPDCPGSHPCRCRFARDASQQ